MDNGLSFYDAINELYINPNIIVRRKSWAITMAICIISDYDVRIKCEDKETGKRRFLDNTDFAALDWEIREVCAS